MAGFFDDVKETADNNKTGLGAGIIGLMLAIFAFDIGIIPSLLVGLGAFALGNYLGDRDNKNSVFNKLFGAKEPQQGLTTGPALDLEVGGPPNPNRAPSLSAEQLGSLSKNGPTLDVSQSGKNVSFNYNGLSNGVLVTMQSEGELNGDKLTLPGTKISVAGVESILPIETLSVAIQPDGTINSKDLEKQLTAIATEQVTKMPNSTALRAQLGVEPPTSIPTLSTKRAK